jgi:hypothetical protein
MTAFNTSKSPEYRKAGVGSVAQRDMKAVINPRPLYALPDNQHFIRFAITGNPM